MALDSDIRQLQANPIFALFDAEALKLLVFSSETRMLRTGDVLFEEGDTSDGGYFVVAGALALTGAELTETVGPGAVAGEAALFAETRRPATAVAQEATVVRRIPRHLMRRVLAEYPGAAQRLRAHLLERIRSVGDGLARVDALLLEDDGG